MKKEIFKLAEEYNLIITDYSNRNKVIKMYITFPYSRWEKYEDMISDNFIENFKQFITEYL